MSTSPQNPEARRRNAPGKRRMTVAQFEEVRPYLSTISLERIEAARMALVEDLSMQSIANHFGWKSRQTVSDAVDRVFEAWNAHQDAILMRSTLGGTVGSLVPAGWSAVTLLVPPELATKFRKEAAIALGAVVGLQHPTKYTPGATPPRRKRVATAKT